MLKHAVSVLKIDKAEDDNDERIIRGWATTPEPDRAGDIVEPEGAQFKNPAPLLWMHRSDSPVGTVEFGKPSKKGIPFIAKMPKIDEAGKLKERIDEAWQSLKSGLVTAVSIGFRALEWTFIEETGGIRFAKTEILELSLVTIPANAGATITSIKSYDKELRAAIGKNATAPTSVMKTTSGASEKKQVKLSPKKEEKTMNLQEQIKQYQAERAAKSAQMLEMMKKSADAGVTLAADEAETYDTLRDEIKAINDHLARLNEALEIQKQCAVPVQTDAAVTVEKSNALRTPKGAPQIIVNRSKDEAFQGQNFTRKVIARALAFMDNENYSDVLRKRWGQVDPHFVEVVTKANEVSAGGSGAGDWGAELVTADGRYTGDFIEYLYGLTVFFDLPLTEVPANVTIKGQDGAATGYWVGENKAIPMSKPDFSNVSLTPLKVAAITALSNELIRDSSPSAERLVRDALAEACAQRVDQTFFSTTAASAGVSPAGILNGIGSTTSHGPTGADLRADIKTLYAPFLAAKNASGIVLAMNPALAKSISLMVNALGQTEFPGLTSEGGTLLGDKVYVGDNITSGQIIALKPRDIWRIGMFGLQISVSREATIEQNSVPAGAGDTPAASANTPVSMFQTEQTAIKAVMPVNFQKRRTSAVSYITGADYGADESSS